MERQATHSLGNGDVLRVVSVPQSARVWLDALASALKMTRSGLAERLETVPCLLPLPPEVDAARLRGYMRVLGVQVDDAPQGHADVHDLSIYVKEGVDPATAVGSIGAVLRSVLPQHTLDLTGLLAGSRSAEVTDLDAATAERLTRRLRRVRQTVVMPSCRSTALYDLFAGPADGAGLRDHLRLLGHPEDPLTGAVASGLDRRTSRSLLRRFPGVRLVNRDFQLFDLMLTRIDGHLPDDIADFLTARTGLRRDSFGLVSPSAPLRLENALPRAIALRFRTDYGSIGLQSYLRLVHPA